MKSNTDTNDLNQIYINGCDKGHAYIFFTISATFMLFLICTFGFSASLLFVPFISMLIVYLSYFGRIESALHILVFITMFILPFIMILL